MSKYSRNIKGVSVDVYDVLKAFDVTDPALQHLVKKALATGKRGHKSFEQDLNEILESAKRAVELNKTEIVANLNCRSSDIPTVNVVSAFISGSLSSDRLKYDIEKLCKENIMATDDVEDKVLEDKISRLVKDEINRQLKPGGAIHGQFAILRSDMVAFVNEKTKE